MRLETSKKLVNALVTDEDKIEADTLALFHDVTATPATPSGRRAALISAIRVEAQRRGKTFDDCMLTCGTATSGTGYDGRFHELEMWNLGLVISEYMASLIGDKAKKGHCHAPGRTKPCPLGRAMHLKMLASFKEDLREFIRAIEDIEKDEPNWPKAEAHAPPKVGP